MDPRWTIKEQSFDPETACAYEGLFTLGSGYMHTRGSCEEGISTAPQDADYLRMPGNVTAEEFPDTPAKWGTYVPGIFGPHPTLNNEMVNLPWFLHLVPFVDGEKLDVVDSSISDHERTLNLQEATLHRKLTWQTRSGPRLTVQFDRFISDIHPHLSVQRMTLRSDRPTTVRVRAGIDADVRTSGYDHLANLDFTGAEDFAGVRCSCSTDGNDDVAMLCQLTPGGAGWAFRSGDRCGACEAEFAVEAGELLTVEKRTAVTTSRDLNPTDPKNVLRSVMTESYEDLRAEHAGRWAERWDGCDVIVEGDDRSQLALRASLYHLMRAHVTDDPRVAIDAKGAAGDAYFGRYFWDTEAYLLPFFIYTDPERARTLTDFRLNTLHGARTTASEYGYPGARYPWESDHQGNNCCPAWQYADHEVHVTADVVYGIQHYARAADPDYLVSAAAETVLETARYWMARIDWRKDDDYPSILGVMGPDEYTPISNNNAYTNWMVRRNLWLAARIGQHAGATEEECNAFRDTADRLPILRGDDDVLILQCEEFPRLAEPQFDRTWPEREGLFANAVSQERLYRTKCLKQADVLMLMMMFPDAFTEEECQAAWDHYVPYTTHDSSLSVGAHAIVASRLGMEQKAFDLFQEGLYKDLDVEEGGAAEGIHIAGCGCNWMVVVFGFAGMRTALERDVLTLAPRLPERWSRMAFPIVWKGTRVFIDVRSEGCEIVNRGEKPITVEVWNQEQTISAATSHMFSCPPGK